MTPTTSLKPRLIVKTLCAAAALGLFGLPAGSAWAQSSSSSSGPCLDPVFCARGTTTDAAGQLAAYLNASPAARALVFGEMGVISQAVVARLTAAAGGKTAGLNIGTGLAGAADGSPWNVWAAASYNGVGYNFAPLASSGRANNALFGLDYGLNNGALVGVVIGSDSTRMSTNFNGGFVNTTGYTVAPYFAVPFGQNWTLDGSLGFGSGKVNANVGGGVAGNTDERRSFGSLALTYIMNVDKWQIQGNAALLSSSVSQKQFTLSNAQVVGSSSSGATQLRAGVRANYGSGDFVPFLGLSVSSDLSSTNVQAVGGQTPANAKSAAYVQAGLNINAGQKVSGSVQVNSELRNQIRNNGVVGTISLKF